MKKYFRNNGRTFYSLLALLMVFAYTPIILSLIMSQRALGESQETLSEFLKTAMTTQIQYIQEASPSQNHTEQIEQLQSETFLAAMGQKETLDYDDDVRLAEEKLLDVTPESSYGVVTTYLYFTKSNYLISSDNIGENSIDSVSDTALLGLDGIDTVDTGTARVYFYRENEKNENVHSIYTAVVFPDVIYIFDIYFPNYMNTERQDISLMINLTRTLKEVELCYYDSYGNYKDVNGRSVLCSTYDFDTIGDDETGYFSVKKDGHYYLCCYTYNSVNTSKFAIFFLDEIAEEQHRASVITWIVAVALLLVFMAIALLYVRRTYRPIKNIMNKIDDGTDQSNGIKDEFAVFNRVLDSYNTKINDRDKLLSKYYLLRMLHGQNNTCLENFNDSWIDDTEGYKYSVATIHVDEYLKDGLYDDNVLEKEIFKFMDKEKMDIRTVAEGDFLHVIFRFKDSASKKCLTNVCRRLQENLRDYYVSIYISNIYDNIKELRRCYSETMLTAEYYITNERLNIVADVEQIPKSEAQEERFMPNFSDLTKLSDCIATLSVDEALQTFDIITEKLKKSENSGIIPDGRRVQNGIVDMKIEGPKFDLLISTIVLAIYDLGLSNDIGKDSMSKDVALLREAKTVNELRNVLSGILQRFGKRVDGQEYYYQKLEAIKEYIRENYSDPNLDATIIADKFGMSQSTVTRLFKKYNGTGFLEYVHEIRVTAAIKLLEGTDLSVAEISGMVGYTNAATMNRAFKAHANTVPSMVRKLKK